VKRACDEHRNAIGPVDVRGAAVATERQVCAEDNGSPSLSATQSFTVVVYPRPTMSAQFSGGQLQLTWPRGNLQQADNVTGPYTDVPNATSPYTITPTGLRKFFRIRL
jgi:hypothetical protein